MIGVWNGLRALAGDALVAAGSALQDQRTGFDEYQAGDFLTAGGRMESDGPDATDQVCECGHRIHDSNVCTACDCRGWFPDRHTSTPQAGTTPVELPDSEVLRTAASIIAGWRPLLLRGAGTDYDVDELDEFVDLLRDRAHQFAALERDSDKPFLTAADLAANVFPQHRGK